MTDPKPFGILTPETHVTGARFSPCGRLIAAPSFDGRVRRWKIPQPGAIPEFPLPELPAVAGHNGYATAVDFHPAREIAYSADSWGQIRAWSYLAENPQPLWTNAEAHDGWIRGLAVGGDGDWIATAGRDGKARVFSTENGGQLAEFIGHDGAELFAVAAHPSGQWAVTGDLFGRVIQWDVKTGTKVKEFDAKVFHLLSRLQDIGGLRRLYFTRDGKQLFASGSKPNGGGNVQGHGRVLIWDFEKGALLYETIVGESDKDIFAHDVALMDDGRFITVTTGQPGQGNVMIFKPGEAAPAFTFNKGTVNCHSVSLSPDGKWFAVSATNTGSNGNGRRLDKEGKYAGNHSPIHFFALDGSTVPEVDPKKKKV